MGIKESIINQSYQLFHKYGIRSVTMDDIAKELSMSKKTLYKYFSNKKDLVFHIMKGQIQDSEKRSFELVKKSKNAIHEFFMVMEMVKTIFHNINPSLLYDLQKYHPKSWALMEKHQNEFIYDMIFQNLKKGIEEKLFRKNLNIEVLVKLRIEEMKTSFNPEIFPPPKYNMEEVQIVMMEHFILGITTLEGHKLANEYQNEQKSSKNE